MLKNNYEYGDYIANLFPDLMEKIDTNNKTSVKTLTFQITQDCSLRCSYCYQHEKFQDREMIFENAKKMIDYLFKHKDDEDFYFTEKKTKGLIIEFIGGEPLLKASLIMKICDYFEEKCLEYPDCPWLIYHRYSISSNGIAYFNEDVVKLREKYGDLFSFTITIDGCKELHDSCRVFPNGDPSYDIVIEAALDQLKNYGNDATKITLSPDNIFYAFKGVKNMYELGFKYINMNSCFEEGWKIDDAKALYQQLKLVADWLKENDYQDNIYFALFDPIKYIPEDDESKNQNWCGTTGSMLALDYKGDIYSCIRFMENSLGESQEPYTIGNLSHGIGNTDIEKERITDLDTLTKLSQSTEECINCPIGKGCSFCTAYNYEKFGTINKRATFICDNHKAGALGSMYFYKITQNKEDYDKIKINYDFIKDIINEEEWNSLQWEE